MDLINSFKSFESFESFKSFESFESFESIDKNLLIKIALQLNSTDLISLCQTCKRMNHLLCENELFWQQKLYKDYPPSDGMSYKIEIFKTYIDTYHFVHLLKGVQNVLRKY